MKKYLTLKNLGWVLTALITLMLGMGGMLNLMKYKKNDKKEI